MCIEGDLVMGQWLVDFWQHEGVYILRVLLAAVLGFVVGLERSHRQKEAGFRTHVIVSIGATLVMLVSKYGFADSILAGMDVDPTRIASNIVTGIGFLGAGVIFVREASIRGLTTAAGLWATAAIGMSIGAGMYALGVFVTLLIVLVQFILHHINRLDSSVIHQLDMRVKASPQATERLREQLKAYGMQIETFQAEKKDNGTIQCTIEVRISRDKSCDDVMLLLDENEYILEIRV